METRFSATAARALLRSDKRDLIRAKIAELANAFVTETPTSGGCKVGRSIGYVFKTGA